jgi:hypothetical protein
VLYWLGFGSFLDGNFAKKTREFVRFPLFPHKFYNFRSKITNLPQIRNDSRSNQRGCCLGIWGIRGNLGTFLAGF